MAETAQPGRVGDGEPFEQRPLCRINAGFVAVFGYAVQARLNRRDDLVHTTPNAGDGTGPKQPPQLGRMDFSAPDQLTHEYEIT